MITIFITTLSVFVRGLWSYVAGSGRFDMLKKWKSRQSTDGLNSLQYEVQKVEFREGYTWMLVAIDMGKVMQVVCVCVCVCVRACVRACVRVCVCVRARAHV